MLTSAQKYCPECGAVLKSLILDEIMFEHEFISRFCKIKVDPTRILSNN